MDDRPQDADCDGCPLENRAATPIDDVLADEIARYRVGAMNLDAGAEILLEGVASPHVYTLVQGVAFRHKSLADGRRQILSYAFPGDLIGVQGSLLGKMRHSVAALADVRLWVFDRSCLPGLFKTAPEAAFALTWRAAKDECVLDETLLSVGRRTALESAAYLLALLHQRARVTGLAPKGRLAFPLTQQHVADTLGLSIVHTNRTLKSLAAARAIAWQDRGCVILDGEKLLEIAGWPGFSQEPRPAF